MENYPDDAGVLTGGLSLPISEALVILFILLALFFVVNTWKREPAIKQARIEAEQELQKCGLEKEDVANNKAVTIIKLQQNPKYARRMQRIAEEAMMSDMGDRQKTG